MINNKIFTKKRISILLFATLSIFIFSLQPAASFALSKKEFTAGMDENTWTMPDFSASNDILYYDPTAGLSCSVGGGGDIDFSDVGGSVDKGLNFGKETARPVNIAKILMADFKFKDYQAAGIVGNFMVEAGVHVYPDINEGGSRGAPKFSGGYGFAQWTGGRQTQFIDFAVKHGYMDSKSVKATDAANYAYLKYELTKTAEKAVVPAIQKSKNVSEAVIAWEKVFERAGKPALGMRLEHGKTVLGKLDGSGGGASTDNVSSGCDDINGGISGGAIFNKVTFPLQVKNKTAIKNRTDLFKDGTTSAGYHNKAEGFSKYLAYDIHVDSGTSVVAFVSGVVTRLHSGSMGEGFSIYNKDKKLHVYYTHMIRDKSIKVGDKINLGDKLGEVASVKQFPKVNVDHLHIDAGPGKIRQGCSASQGSGGPACNNRVDIGPDLFNAYQAIGGKGNGSNTDAPKAL
ncbi:MAG: phage tail tip lysozyme [bacterium]|nr:phage tail tip lysozyme [bacterium]